MCRELLDRRQRGGRVPDSWFERLVERCVSRIDLPPWVCQHVVHGADGAVVGRLDLACPALLLGVEGHSRQFHFGVGPEALDELRDNRLGALGWHLVYVGWYATESTGNGRRDDRRDRSPARRPARRRTSVGSLTPEDREVPTERAEVSANCLYFDGPAISLRVGTRRPGA